MDPLSTTASIIAVVQLSSDVVKFVSRATGATKERKRLREEIRACDYILQQLKDETDDSDEGKEWTETIRALEAPGAPLGRLLVALSVVKAKLQPKRGLKNAFTALEWPFEEKEVERIIGAMEREKNLLELILTNNCRKLTQDIKRSSKENGRQLAELIEAVKGSSTDNQSQFAELKDDLTCVHGLQAGLKEGLAGLHEREDCREAVEQRQLILNWFTPVDYAPQQTDFINRRQAGTGQWLLNSAEYQAWLKTEKQTLFCPGIPGAGKTILASIVIDHLTRQFSGDPMIGIAYIYCDFRRNDEQKAKDLLPSLLKQLAWRQSFLPASVKELYNRHYASRTGPTLDEVARTLQSVAAMYSRVFIVVDALDECQTSDGCRTRFLSELFSLQRMHGTNIFATSRCIPEIVGQFKGFKSLEIRARREDLERYLAGHIKRLPSFVQRNLQLQEEIKTGISEAADGMFLLAQIYLSSLDDKTTPKAVRSALKNFQQSRLKQSQEPSEYKKEQVLARAYEHAMERINGQKPGLRELAMQVLSWITYAKRPLTTTELQHALAVEVGRSELDNDNIPDVEDLVSFCAGLVTVDNESGIIRLVHYTTQEFFERTQKDWFPYGETDITNACIAYLSLSKFRSGLCRTEEDFRARLRSNPFYCYAARHWGLHACKARVSSRMIMTFLENDTYVQSSSQALVAEVHNSYFPNYSQEVSRPATGTHLAAYFGLEKAMSTLVMRHDFDAKDIWDRTPLSWAAENGHESTVQLLLNSGRVNADSKAKGAHNFDRTPLSYAAENGHNGIVRLLLDSGQVDVNLKDIRGWSPLLYAAKNGQNTTVKLLLENGQADADSKDNKYGQTPLSWAAWRGNEGVVKTLLESGKVNADSKDVDGRTPLLYAAARGHEPIVRLLLESGRVNTCSKDNDDWTSLLYAAARGHDAIVRVLLSSDQGGAKSTAEEYDNGRTPILYAAANGHETIAKLLLDRGQVFGVSPYGQTPLSCAAAKGHEGIVKLLLRTGNVHADCKDKGGRTPLLYAAAKGHEAIVKLLLSTSQVDPDSKESCYGRTPLSYAAAKGHKAIVKILLDTGRVDADSKDANGWTPLLYATVNGHYAVVRQLLGTGHVDPDSEIPHLGRTALSFAAEKGYTAVVEVLLESGKANAKLKDSRYGETPLTWAAWSGHEAVVSLLQSS